MEHVFSGTIDKFYGTSCSAKVEVRERNFGISGIVVGLEAL